MTSTEQWIVKFDLFRHDGKRESWQSVQTFPTMSQAIMCGITVCHLWPAKDGYLQATPVQLVPPCEIDQCLIDSLLNAAGETAPDCASIELMQKLGLTAHNSRARCRNTRLLMSAWRSARGSR